jgi:YgiT-type zinc finger domain-containing protein
MICLICRQVETVDGLTTIHFERGEMRLLVNNVPARVCPGCGEAYVEEDVAVLLLQVAEASAAAGELDRVIEYDAPIKLLDSPHLK